MKYEFKLQSTATDAARNINKAYSDNTVNVIIMLLLGRLKVNKVKMEYVDEDDLKREEM